MIFAPLFHFLLFTDNEHKNVPEIKCFVCHVVRHHDVTVHMWLKVHRQKVYLLPKYGGEWSVTLYPGRLPGPHSHPHTWHQYLSPTCS